jgi:hypothetical protein
MKFSLLSSLGDFYSKKIGFVMAFSWLVVEIVLRIRGVVDKPMIGVANIMFLGGLFMTVFSKEKIDDERFLAIRYFSFKTTLLLFVITVVTVYSFWYNVDAIYYAIGALIGYLMIYYFCVFFNPDFIFKETTQKSRINSGFILILMVFVQIGFALYWISEILKM